MALQDPFSSSHLAQDENRNSPNSFLLKQKALALKLVCTIPTVSERGRSALYAVLIAGFYCGLLAIDLAWEKWRIKGNDLF